MKRIQLLFCTIFLASSLSFLAFAATDATIYTESSVSAVIPGDSFTYSVYLSGTYDGYCFEIANTLAPGITVTAVTPASSDVNADEWEDSWMVSVIGGLVREDSDKVKIVDVTATTIPSFTGATLSLKNVIVTTDTGDESSVTTAYGEIKAKSILFNEFSDTIQATYTAGEVGDSLFLAIYNHDGKLINVKMTPWKQTGCFVSDTITAGETAKAFVFDANLSPKCEVYIFKK